MYVTKSFRFVGFILSALLFACFGSTALAGDAKDSKNNKTLTRTERAAKELEKSVGVDKKYIFDKTFDSQESIKKSLDLKESYCCYKLKINFDDIEGVKGDDIPKIIFLQAFLEKVFEDPEWARNAEIKSLAEAEKLKESEEYRKFFLNEKNNDESKQIFRLFFERNTWFSYAEHSGDYSSSKKSPCKHFTFDFSGTPRLIAEEFNNISKKYIEKFTAGKIDGNTIKRYAERASKRYVKKLRNFEKYLKSDQNLHQVMLKKNGTEIKRIEKKLKELNGYLKNPEKFKEYMKKFAVPYEKKIIEIGTKNVKSIEESIKKPENKKNEGWFLHMKGIEDPIIAKAYLKNIEKILKDDELLKKYINSCIEYGKNKLEDLNGTRINFGSVNNFESWIKKIEDCDEKELERIAKSLKSITLSYLYGPCKENKN